MRKLLKFAKSDQNLVFFGKSKVFKKKVEFFKKKVEFLKKTLFRVLRFFLTETYKKKIKKSEKKMKKVKKVEFLRNFLKKKKNFHNFFKSSKKRDSPPLLIFGKKFIEKIFNYFDEFSMNFCVIFLKKK